MERIRQREPVPPEAVRENSHNIANLLQNMAYCHIRLNQPDDAKRRAEEALPYLADLRNPELLSHRVSDLELRGAVAFLRGEHKRARDVWTAALTLAFEDGDRERTAAIANNLHLLSPAPSVASQAERRGSDDR
jgi:tetratricopeptide (TPR) repeat protein